MMQEMGQVTKQCFNQAVSTTMYLISVCRTVVDGVPSKSCTQQPRNEKISSSAGETKAPPEEPKIRAECVTGLLHPERKGWEAAPMAYKLIEKARIPLNQVSGKGGIKNRSRKNSARRCQEAL